MRVPWVKHLTMMVGLVAMTIGIGAVGFAAEDTEGKRIGPSTEITKENLNQPTAGMRDDLIISDLTKEAERPMSVPDPRSEMSLPDRQPLCGPWKNAINHVYCAPGYDSFSF